MVRVDGAGAIVLFIFAALYVIFQITVTVLIIRNKLRRRREQKRLRREAGYKELGSDIELGHRPRVEQNGIQQLPTNDEGGEDLEGKPKLEVEGNPVHQLDGHDQPRAPFELQNSSTGSSSTVVRSQSRRPIPSVHIEINNAQEAVRVRDV